MEIKKLSGNDTDTFSKLIDVFAIVFEKENFSKPENLHLQSILANPNLIAIVATEGGKIIGGLTAYVLHQYYSTQPIVYIYDLAVLQGYQGKGIGLSLIGFLKSYCKEKYYSEMYVPVEKEDIEAVQFYKASQYSFEQEVLYFNYLM